MGLLTRYPVDVMICEVRGNEILMTRDKAVRIHKKGTGDMYYQLKKRKTKIPPVSYDHIYMMQDFKGNRKQVIYLYSMTPYTFVPLKFNPELASVLASGTLTRADFDKLVPDGIKKATNPSLDMEVKIDDKWIYWAAQQLKQNVYRAQYRTTLEKMLPIAMFAVAGIVIGIIVYMTIGQMDIIAGSFTSAAESMRQMAAEMSRIATGMGSITPTTAPPF